MRDGVVIKIGSLSNGDGDDIENGTKAIGLDQQNNNFARASRFFVHFLAVVARLRSETNFMSPVYKVGEHNTKIFFFFFF